MAVEVMASKKPRSDSPASPSTQAGTRSLLAQHKASIKGQSGDQVPWRAVNQPLMCMACISVCIIIMMMAEQDDLLEEIGQGVGRLKDQSKRINEEAEVQLVR